MIIRKLVVLLFLIFITAYINSNDKEEVKGPSDTTRSTLYKITK